MATFGSIRGRLAPALLGLLCLVCAPSHADAIVDKRQQIDALFAPCAAPGRPGAAVSIVSGGKTVFEAYYGTADIGRGIPITAATQFNIASVSKQFTSFAIALLTREGKVDVEADVRRYLPFVPDFGYSIQVKHLLSHTSGLRDLLDSLDFSGHDIAGIIRRQQVINIVSRQRSLRFVPGSQYSYSNTNTFLLSEIVRQVSGQSIREFIHARILQPLDMTRSDMVDDITEIVPELARSYRFDSQRQRWQQVPLNSEAVGATGLLTTAGDLAKWLANFGHPRVGDAALIEQVTTPAVLNDGTPVMYNYGLVSAGKIGLRAWDHSGSEAAFGSQVAYFPDYDVGIAVLMNGRHDCAKGVVAAFDEVARIWLSRPVDVAAERARDSKGKRTVPAKLRAALEGVWAVDFDASRDAKSGWTGVSGVPFKVTNADGQLTLQPFLYSGMYEGKAAPAPVLLQLGSGEVLYPQGAAKFAVAKSYRVRRAADGAVIGLEYVTAADQPVVTYRRINVPELTPAQLAEYVGDYRNAEVDVTYRVSIEQGRIMLRSMWEVLPTTSFRAMGTDRFDSSSRVLGTLLFERDEHGRPSRIRIQSSALSNLLLDRIE